MTKLELMKNLKKGINERLLPFNDKIIAIYSNSFEIELYSFKGEKFIINRRFIEKYLKRSCKLKLVA